MIKNDSLFFYFNLCTITMYLCVKKHVFVCKNHVFVCNNHVFSKIAMQTAFTESLHYAEQTDE